MATFVKPTFLFIGTTRSGSSWLYEILSKHPEVYVPEAKDIYFFDRYFDLGPDWYFEHFKGGKYYKAVGEISHDYLVSDTAAHRIHDMLPDVQLVIWLREPADVLQSLFLAHQVSGVIDRNTSLAEAIKDPEMLHFADYYPHLKVYFELFPRENILIQFYDDQNDPKTFISQTLLFLGANPHIEARQLHRRVLPARRPRSYLLVPLAYKFLQVLRKQGLSNMVGRLKRNSFLKRLAYEPMVQKPEIPLAVKHEIYSRFSPDYPKIAQLIGKPLPRAWTLPVE